MTLIYQNFIRPLLFQLESEQAHKLTLNCSKLANLKPVFSLIDKLYEFEDHRLGRELFGIKFKSPIGMAAGLDKDCVAVSGMSAIGFSFLELGGVTAKRQTGNPAPRVFRLIEEQAVINRLGLPSVGAQAAASNLLFSLASTKKPAVIAINIAKSHNASFEQAIPDYQATLKYFYDLCQFFVLNVSCPNEENYQRLQEKDQLHKIMHGVQQSNTGNKPLLVKLSPDLNEQQLDDVLECCISNSIAGVIAGNTTTTRPNQSGLMQQKGGLSGRPIFARTLENVSAIYKKTEGKLPIIACGGISSADDAIACLKAGASLIQIYTAMIYQGPGLVKEIKKGIVEYLEKEGLSDISQIRPPHTI